jgi:hypothetical protein
MNREDIIRMAREACDTDKVDAWHNGFWTLTQEEIERFAALVAAAEREKVAKWQMGSGYSTGHGETIEDLLVELEWQVRESEREACAKVCDRMASRCNDIRAAALESAAENIRARGQA